MKIKKIIDICKSKGAIILYEGQDEQWISDGCAIYPMFNLPRFDEASLCAAYDIDDKKAQKMVFRHEHGLPAGIDFSDGESGEIPAERIPMVLSYGGRSIIPYMTSQGVMFIDAKHLQPLVDMDDGMMELYERQTESGEIYFAVKTGFILVGIIAPVDVVNDQFVERLESLLTQCKITLFNKKSALEQQQENNQLSAFDIVNATNSQE